MDLSQKQQLSYKSSSLYQIKKQNTEEITRKLQNKIKKIENKNRVQKKFDIFPEKSDFDSQTPGQYLQSLDQWKFNQKYKNHENIHQKLDVNENYDNFIKYKYSGKQILNQTFLNSIVNDSISSQQHLRGQKNANNPFFKNNQQNQNQSKSLKNIKNQQRQIQEINKSPYKNNDSISLSEKNLEQDENSFDSDKSIKFQRKTMQNIKNFEVFKKDTQYDTNTVEFILKHQNKKLLNNMMVERMKKKLNHLDLAPQFQTQKNSNFNTNQNTNQNSNQNTDQNINQNSNKNKEFKFIDAALERKQEINDLYKQQSHHFQTEVLESFKNLYKYFDKPYEALNTKKIIQNMRNFYINPPGLKQLQFNEKTQSQIEQLRSIDQDEHFKQIEKVYLQDFKLIKSLIKQNEEKIEKYQAQLVEFLAEIDEIKKTLNQEQKNYKQRHQEIQQLQKQKNFKWKNAHQLEQQISLQQMQNKDNFEQNRKKLNQKIEQLLSQIQYNKSLINTLEQEKREAKDKKHINEVALHNLYLEMMKNNKFSKDSLVWVIKALYRIECDVTTADIYPLYLDNGNKQFLQDYAYQSLMMDECIEDLNQLIDKTNFNKDALKILILKYQEERTNKISNKKNMDKEFNEFKNIISEGAYENTHNQENNLNQNQQIASNRNKKESMSESDNNLDKILDKFQEIEKKKFEQEQTKSQQKQSELAKEHERFINKIQELKNKLKQAEKKMEELKKKEIERIIQTYKQTHDLQTLKDLQRVYKDLFGAFEGEYQYRYFLQKIIISQQIRQKNKTFTFSDQTNIFNQRNKQSDQSIFKYLDQDQNNLFKILKKGVPTYSELFIQNMEQQLELQQQKEQEQQQQNNYINENSKQFQQKNQNFILQQKNQIPKKQVTFQSASQIAQKQEEQEEHKEQQVNNNNKEKEQKLDFFNLNPKNSRNLQFLLNYKNKAEQILQTIDQQKQSEKDLKNFEQVIKKMPKKIKNQTFRINKKDSYSNKDTSPILQKIYHQEQNSIQNSFQQHNKSESLSHFESILSHKNKINPIDQNPPQIKSSINLTLLEEENFKNQNQAENLNQNNYKFQSSPNKTFRNLTLNNNNNKKTYNIKLNGKTPSYKTPQSNRFNSSQTTIASFNKSQDNLQFQSQHQLYRIFSQQHSNSQQKNQPKLFL